MGCPARTVGPNPLWLLPCRTRNNRLQSKLGNSTPVISPREIASLQPRQPLPSLLSRITLGIARDEIFPSALGRTSVTERGICAAEIQHCIGYLGTVGVIVDQRLLSAGSR